MFSEEKKTIVKKQKSLTNSTVDHNKAFTRCITINSGASLPKGTLVSQNLIHA